MVGPNLALVCLSSAALAAAQSFQSTPVLGWNSYNQVSCSPTQDGITKAINALADRGFVAAGYNFFQIDCGWASRDGRRNSTTGALAIDTNAFPDGLKPLSDLARSKGMKWTMYSDAGVRMCDLQVPSPVLGSLGHEAQDAEFFKSLNTEYLKCKSPPIACLVKMRVVDQTADDNCYASGPNASENAPKAPRTDFPSRFGVMWKELQRVGVPGMLICQWGTPYSSPSGLEGPNEWTKGISTSFRLSDDIARGWGNVYRIYNQAVHVAASGAIGPRHIGDADLLEVGNPGMTFDEQATHFAAWAMLKSALMISTDVAALSADTVKVLQNKDLLAINQDSAVKPITLKQRWTSDRDLWSGDLANGDVAVLVVDLSNATRTLSVQLSTLGIQSATIKDLWSGKTTTGSSYSKPTNAHGSLALRLSNIKSISSMTKYNYISASTGSLAGGADIQSCAGCTSNNKVGNLGGPSNGALTLSNIRTSQATQIVRFDYINAEVGYLGGSNNERLASVSVNGAAAQTVSFPLTGYNWVEDVSKGYAVELSGFSTTGTNTIVVKGVGSGYAPDIDRIGVVA